MNSSLDYLMRHFAELLDVSWGAALAVANNLKQLDSTELISDWLQANWEILVEAPFSESVGIGRAYLEPYGDGAECNGASSRVWKPNALPTHRVLCLARESQTLLDLLTGRAMNAADSPVVFDHFATTSDCGWHEQAPPFDCILGYLDDQEVLIRLVQVEFLAAQIGESYA